MFFSFWHPCDLDVRMFKVVLEILKPLLIFLNSCFSILFWSNVYFNQMNSPMNSPVRLGVSPTASSPTGFFSVWGLEALFPCTETLGCVVCLAPQLFLPVYPHANMGLPSPPAISLPQVLSTQLSMSVSPTGLDECFFFNSLVVRLPYNLIFWQVFFFFLICPFPSFNCSRSHSLSTYASILAISLHFILFKK